MKTKFFIDDVRVSKKLAMTLITEEQLKEAFEDFKNDPMEIQSWRTAKGTLSVEFSY